MYFAIFKLLLDGWIDLFQALHGITDHSFECQHVLWLYQIPHKFCLKGFQISNILLIQESFVYLHILYLHEVTVYDNCFVVL